MKHLFFSSILVCGLLRPWTGASAQDFPIVDISLQHDAVNEQLHISLRANQFAFGEIVSNLVFTIRWPGSSPATLSFGSSAWCPAPSQGLPLGPSAQVAPGNGFNYRTWSSVGQAWLSAPLDDSGCGQVLPADAWVEVFTIPVVNDLGGTVFEIADDQFALDDNRSYYISLNGESITGNGESITGEIYSFSTGTVQRDEPVLAISLLPNPTNGVVILTAAVQSATPLAIEVYDPAGRGILKTLRPSVIGTHRETIDMSTFSDGVYMVQVRVGDQISQHRLVVDHH